jgi:hypothetical protein
MPAGQLLSMDRNVQILILAGVIVTLLLLLVSFHMAGIVFVLLVVIVMSLMIMKDSASLPDVVAELSEDAKAVIIRNSGNAVAEKIHVAVVPVNTEFDLPSLAVDGTHDHPLGQMVEEVKVVIRFQNEKGTSFSRTYRLSALEGGFEPLKPMIPIFGWK